MLGRAEAMLASPEDFLTGAAIVATVGRGKAERGAERSGEVKLHFSGEEHLPRGTRGEERREATCVVGRRLARSCGSFPTWRAAVGVARE
jgi:hypothetical protein